MEKKYIEGVQPGMEIISKPGEKLEGFSPTRTVWLVGPFWIGDPKWTCYDNEEAAKHHMSINKGESITEVEVRSATGFPEGKRRYAIFEKDNSVDIRHADCFETPNQLRESYRHTMRDSMHCRVTLVWAKDMSDAMAEFLAGNGEHSSEKGLE